MDSLESWKIDVERSTLRFRLPHALLGEIGGQFACWGGRVQIDPGDLRRSTVRIWVELASLSTGSRGRDEEILETELFDQRWEPAVEFDGESVELDQLGRLVIQGWLSLRVFRERISILVDSSAIRVDSSGTLRFVCAARGSIARRALGLHRPKKVGRWLSDQVLGETIEIAAHVEAVRETAGVLNGLAPSVSSNGGRISLLAEPGWGAPHVAVRGRGGPQIARKVVEGGMP